MKFFTKLRLKIRDFIKKHKNKVILIIIGWICVIVVNYIVSNWNKQDTLINTYAPHEPIFETGETVSQSLQKEITSLIDEYMSYCNAKEYEKAYNMITQECREVIYPNLGSFKSYVDYVFRSEKIYNIQNYANKNSKYIYRIRILDDILESGLTYQDGVRYFEDKFIIEKKNGKLTLAVKEYVNTEELEKVYEDKYMKIVVTKKVTMLEEEIYTLRITNRTGNYLVLADNSDISEITMNTEKSIASQTEEGNNIVLSPEESTTVKISFLNFYDEGQVAQKINFNKVRILKNHIDNREENEKEENVIETYSTSISVK